MSDDRSAAYERLRNNPQRRELAERAQAGAAVAAEMDDFEKSMIALRLELPDIVWRDVWRRWCGLRRLMTGPLSTHFTIAEDGTVLQHLPEETK